MAKRILGMVDVIGIIEKAQEAADLEQMEAAERMLREGFTMNDLLDQMRMIKKMGGAKSILGLLGNRVNRAVGDIDEGVFTKNEAIILSMTKEERARPKTINGQRRARIARGSGTTVQEVNQLIKQWGEMNKMMGKMRSMAAQMGGGKKGKKGKKLRMPNIPGLGNMGGGMDMEMLRNMEREMQKNGFGK